MSDVSPPRPRLTIQLGGQHLRVVIVVLAGLAAIALGILVLVNDHFDNEAYLAWASIALGAGLFVREAVHL
jgi:hypothetical protein